MNRTDEVPFVTAAGVTRVYRSNGQPVPALRGVNIDLPKGVFAVLKGRSGSGKTTLLNIIGGLDRPTDGQITFDGQSLGEMSERDLNQLRRRRMGFIFQSFALMPTYSAYENVELVLRISGRNRREQVQGANRCLRAVGLTRWMDHRPDEMSGGQQQRVAIARALATRPELILADEPTGELDTHTSRQIFALFREIVAKEAITILATTHDPLVDEYADVIYTLCDGVIEKQERRLSGLNARDTL
jgi:ABC-type lipoprotein export system ATPase subunit